MADNLQGETEIRLREIISAISAALPSRVPVSTYRLQFNSGFRLPDAGKIAGYLNALGITDIYSSPYFKATEGSTHGYDITDYLSINPEIGTEEDFSRLSSELGRLGMGMIMDVVPNHMSIASSRNAWWQDVLENGPASPFASYFDIDWKPVKEVLENKVILPILGGQYGEVLEDRQLRLSFEGGAFFINYFDHRLPVDPSTYTLILTHDSEALEAALGEEDARYQEFLSIVTALTHLPTCLDRDPEKVTERLREKEIIKKRISALHEECAEFGDYIEERVRVFNGTENVPGSFDLLDSLLSSQVYRLSYWQVATEEINYRRFFDINDLAAIRTEDPEVFRETHRMVLGHIEEKKVTGLRVDHPDGLYSPADYFRWLQEECFVALACAELAARSGGGMTEDTALNKEIRRIYRKGRSDEPALERPFYIVGEKILVDSERVPEDWPVFGTTGYVFMNSVNGLFVNADNAKLLTGIYQRFLREKINYPQLVYEKKRLIMESSMASEINVLGHSLNRISESDRHFRDLTLQSLINAIVEVIAFFPVYRTYTDASGVKERDVRYIETAISRARRHRRDLSGSIFDFIRDVLTLSYPETYDEETRQQWIEFTMKFQQLTGPVMAKGLEDTVFYNYNRLVSLNEVGGNPERFGTRLGAFHGQNIETQKNLPLTMVATSTHDSKRSEDVRARVNVLSELPLKWRDCLSRWGRMNKRHKSRIEGQLAPFRNDEYLLYQTLLGSWPFRTPEGDEMEAYRERMTQYMTKAAREAKEHTTWINPDAEYEEALSTFLRRILSSQQFLEDFMPVQKWVAHFGMFNSLSQTLLKITSPGIPDFYQGTELWNLSLVDPDNRRPVDYSSSTGMLGKLMEREAAEGPRQLARELLSLRKDGRIKLYLIWKALNFRKGHRELFLKGEYVPLYASGNHNRHIVSFERRTQAAASITVAPRLITEMTASQQEPVGDVWRGSFLALPGEKEGTVYRDVFTGTSVEAVAHDGQAALAVENVLSDFPVALLEKAGSGEGK